MVIPTLLLKPSGSRDRNGPVSPTLTGAVRVVEGEHGPAWFVEEGGIIGVYTKSDPAMLQTSRIVTPEGRVPMQNHDTPHTCACGCGTEIPLTNTIAKGHNRRRSAVDRFWENVRVLSDDECWEWQGGRNEQGYGRFRVDGKLVRAHRFSYALHNGDLRDDDVLHSCDNPPCCNPHHLFSGTNDDNIEDRNEKGRQAKGEMVGGSKLTVEQVRMIRDDTDSLRAIGRKHGISHSQVLQIKRGKFWRHV